MSHANGMVKFCDGLILHCEYNGGVDIMLTPLWKSNKEVHDNWRTQPLINCACGQEEPVEIATDYGGGFYWEGKACRFCMCITDHRSPFDYNDERINMSREDGLPVWW